MRSASFNQSVICTYQTTLLVYQSADRKVRTAFRKHYFPWWDRGVAAGIAGSCCVCYCNGKLKELVVSCRSLWI